MTTGSHSTRVVNDLGKRLLEAARNGNTEEVKLLMTNGAPLTTDWLGTTPLHLASIYGHTSTAEILIKSGINRDSRTKVDKAPLHFACQHGHIEIVKLLVSGGAHINATDMLKMTPLHWAVEANKFEICLILIKAGVNTDLRNKFGKTSLKIASEKKYHSIVQLLSAEKIKILQELDVLGQQDFRNHSVTSVEICRPGDHNNLNNNLKKQKTHRFPMVAGTWTGGEAQSIDRQDMHERKMFGSNFNKKRPLITTPTDILTPSLGSLQLFNSKKHTEDMSKEQSPLQQLVEAVRQSTSNLESENQVERRMNKAADTTTKSNAVDVAKDELCKEVKIPPQLPVNIPVISSLALKSLPPNIKAIPLQINIKDHLNSTANKPTNEQLKKDDEQVTSSKPTMDVPVELLNQIMNGEVFLHSLASKSKDAAGNHLIAINTEMGTIPIIPVKGEGGLQLIPVQNEVQPRQPSPSMTPPMIRHQPPAVLYPVNRSSYPSTPLSLVPHTTTGVQPRPPFEGNVLRATNVTSQPVQTPMLLPTGIYVQPGHPAFLQLHRPPPHSTTQAGQISIYPPPPHSPFTHGHSSQPPLFPTAPILQSAARPQFLVHSATATGSPTFIQPHLPTSYVYVERDDG